jgi:hypothetical protein
MDSGVGIISQMIFAKKKHLLNLPVLDEDGCFNVHSSEITQTPAHGIQIYNHSLIACL